MTQLDYVLKERLSRLLVWSGIVLAIVFSVSFLLKIGHVIPSFHKGITGALFDNFIILLRILCCIWSVMLAKRLNRYPLFWGLFTIAFPPIVMIILLTRDFKVKREYKAVVKKYRDEYFMQYEKITKEFKSGQITREYFQNEVENLRKVYAEKLNSEIERIEQEKENSDFIDDSFPPASPDNK